MSRVPIPAVALHNIRDAAGFVTDAVGRLGLELDDTEREDLIGEGLMLLIEMGNQWAPQEHGDGTGSFMGYAHTFLPRRLLDAWHRWHREHTYATKPDGSRAYVYGHPPEALYDAAGEARQFVATGCGIGSFNEQQSMEAAIRLLPAEYRIAARPVVNGALDGRQPHEIARQARMTTRDVHQIHAALGSAMYQLNQEAA